MNISGKKSFFCSFFCSTDWNLPNPSQSGEKKCLEGDQSLRKIWDQYQPSQSGFSVWMSMKNQGKKEPRSHMNGKEKGNKSSLVQGNINLFYFFYYFSLLAPFMNYMIILIQLQRKRERASSKTIPGKLSEHLFLSWETRVRRHNEEKCPRKSHKVDEFDFSLPPPSSSTLVWIVEFH